MFMCIWNSSRAESASFISLRSYCPILHRKVSARFPYCLPTPCAAPASTSLLWDFPALSFRCSFTGTTEQEPCPSSVCGGLCLPSDPQASRAGRMGVCWASQEQSSRQEGRGVARMSKHLLGVQKLNSSCMDDASLPLSPRETRLYVQICNRSTKLLFHSC